MNMLRQRNEPKIHPHYALCSNSACKYEAVSVKVAIRDGGRLVCPNCDAELDRDYKRVEAWRTKGAEVKASRQRSDTTRSMETEYDNGRRIVLHVNPHGITIQDFGQDGEERARIVVPGEVWAALLVTPEAVERALSRATEEAELPYMARSRDYPDREALRAADRQADSKNSKWMHNVLIAALGFGK